MLLLALAACAAFEPPPTPEEELRRAVSEPAQIAGDASWVGIRAETDEAAWGQIVRARTEEPLEPSRVLARAFEETRSEPRQIVVGGPHAKLNEQVLRDAFLIARGRLDDLRVVYVSVEPLSQELVRACRERGAVCVYQRWVPPPPD